jgi:CDP-glycerol glycerophosphotransferase
LVSLGTILDNQLAALRSTFGPAVPISIVVGFGADALIAACPTLTYVRNDRWKHTDTAYGLGCALRGRPTTGVLWLPGDVVCEARSGPMAAGESCPCSTRRPSKRPNPRSPGSAGKYDRRMPPAVDQAPLQVVILAAGFGSRLGKPFPKPLTPLVSGRTILGRQLDCVRSALGEGTSVIVVVGFKLELIMEAAPEVLFAYNERYDQTNTCKSLLRALRLTGPGGVLWLNGDVVFDPAILSALRPQLAAGQSFVCVNTAAVGDEEIKYTVDAAGMIRELSKTVQGGLGEAIGINHVSATDKQLLCKHLESCADEDYFERGIETAVAAGMRVLPLDISAWSAVEVDFAADLDRANEVAGGS